MMKIVRCFKKLVPLAPEVRLAIFSILIILYVHLDLGLLAHKKEKTLND